MLFVLSTICSCEDALFALAAYVLKCNCMYCFSNSSNNNNNSSNKFNSCRTAIGQLMILFTFKCTTRNCNIWYGNIFSGQLLQPQFMYQFSNDSNKSSNKGQCFMYHLYFQQCNMYSSNFLCDQQLFAPCTCCQNYVIIFYLVMLIICIIDCKLILIDY